MTIRSVKPFDKGTKSVNRTSQQIPIVFAGSYLSHRDLDAEVKSIDIMPTILRAMGITPTKVPDGTAYPVPFKNK